MIFLELLSMQHVPWVERYLLGISNWAFLVLLSNQDSYEKHSVDEESWALSWTECLCPSKIPMLKPRPHVIVLGGRAFGR